MPPAMYFAVFMRPVTLLNAVASKNIGTYGQPAAGEAPEPPSVTQSGRSPLASPGYSRQSLVPVAP